MAGGRPYTVLLGSALITPGDPIPLFSTVQGYVTIVRDYVFVNTSGAESDLNVYRITGSQALGLYFAVIPSRTTVHLELRQVIPPGSTVYAVTAQGYDEVSITGYQLIDERAA